MGGNRALREHYRCRITIPAGEVGHIVPWSAQSCWSAQMDQYAEEFAFDDTLSAGDEFAGGHLRWQAIAAPGHDMDALMFWSAEAGILITGDALWERGLGFVFPGETGDSADNHSSFMAAALATLDAIEALQPRWIIPGHGAPFQGVSAAIDFARSRLTALAADPVKNARAVVRSLFVFALLDQGGMAIDTVPGYLASVPVYRDLGARFLRQESACLAATLVADLVKVGAIRVAGQRIEPTLRA
jgi:glyoxylase-like metal-dependent hydrolase (beta-lactamase superfamily II)